METKRTLIIAEAGVNHNGNIELAHKLVDVAKATEADVVKFQTFFDNAAEGIAIHTPKADYQKQTTGENGNMLDMITALALKPEDFLSLKKHCEDVGIIFLSTAFDVKCLDFLRDMGLNTWKLPSGEITNLPYLRHAGSLGGRIIMSTGMCTLGEVDAAIDVLENAGAGLEDITLLHCTTEYPAPVEDVNLKAMLTLKNAFPGLNGVGYSDHTQGIEIPIAAVAMGACVIEKHLTLDNNMPGPDHQASLEPAEFTAMVKAIRRVEVALGDGRKKSSPSEASNMLVARRSLFALKPIKKGEILNESNMGLKRPGTGVSPMRWDEYCGRPAGRDYDTDEAI